MRPIPMSRLEKRSLSLAGHRTSVALEPEFWAVLEEAATTQSLSLAGLVAASDASRRDASEPLASRLRLLALRYARARIGSAEAGR